MLTGGIKMKSDIRKKLLQCDNIGYENKMYLENKLTETSTFVTNNLQDKSLANHLGFEHTDSIATNQNYKRGSVVEDEMQETKLDFTQKYSNIESKKPESKISGNLDEYGRPTFNYNSNWMDNLDQTANYHSNERNNKDILINSPTTISQSKHNGRAHSQTITGPPYSSNAPQSYVGNNSKESSALRGKKIISEWYSPMQDEDYTSFGGDDKSFNNESKVLNMNTNNTSPVKMDIN